MTGRRRRCRCFLAMIALILISLEAAAAAAGADDGPVSSILLSQSAAESMTFLGNASYGRTGQQIELTNPLPRSSNATTTSSGRALYNVPLQMLNPATSFDTTFAFATSGGGGGGGAAPSSDSGLSFVIVPNNQDLGSAPSRHAFSVEFSSSSNTIGVWSGAEWVAAVNASFDLGSGSRSFAWIRYDCQARRIEVRASNLSAMPASPVIAQDLDLSTVFNEFMFVGFSASSVASAAAKNTIYAWNFTSWIAKPSSHPDPASLSASSSSSSSSSTSSSSSSRRRGITAAGIAVGVVLAAIAVVALITRQIRRASSSSKNAFTRADDNNAPSDQHSLLRRFSFKELVAATKNFAITEKLGADESVSRCYRGVLSDSVVAVKIASKDPAFAQESQQLLSEMASLRHRNLARLLGWCSSDALGSLLVYEFVPNGSLDQHLFKSEQGKQQQQQQPPLPWSHRHKIACGLAQALEHLHARGIVHGNVKSSNVMLDSSFSARLGDFGLRSSTSTNLGLGQSSLVVAGTFGYVAPEAVQTGRLSKQSDVFAFGAVLLELACGRRALESELDQVVVLVDLVRQQQQQQGRRMMVVDEAVVDPKLGGLYDVSEMETLVRVGLVCSDTDPNARPSMEMVVKILAGEASPPRLHIEAEQQQQQQQQHEHEQQQQRPIEELLVMKDFGSLFVDTSSSPSSSGDRLFV